MVEICKPTHDHPYVSFLLSLALHHCKYNLTCAAVHESSEILTAVTVNYRSQVTAVVPQGFEPRLFCTKNRRVANYTIGQFYPVTPSVNILIALSYLQPTEVKVLYILSQNHFVLERIQRG